MTMMATSDSDELFDAIPVLADRKHPGATPLFRELLSTSPDGGIRNACALALLHLADDERIDILTRRIRDPTTFGNRGTLVYALSDADVRHLLPLLTELILTDTYEVRWTAMGLVKAMNGPIDPTVAVACLNRALEYLQSIDPNEKNATDNLEMVEALTYWLEAR